MRPDRVDQRERVAVGAERAGRLDRPDRERHRASREPGGEELVRDPAGWTRQPGERLGHAAPVRAELGRGHRADQGLAHQRVPEPVAEVRGLDDQLGQPVVEVPVGLLLARTGHGEQLVGGERRCRAEPPARRCAGPLAGGQAARSAAPLAGWRASSSARNGRPPLTSTMRSAVRLGQVREPLRQQAPASCSRTAAPARGGCRCPGRPGCPRPAGRRCRRAGGGRPRPGPARGPRSGRGSAAAAGTPRRPRAGRRRPAARRARQQPGASARRRRRTAAGGRTRRSR